MAKYIIHVINACVAVYMANYVIQIINVCVAVYMANYVIHVINVCATVYMANYVIGLRVINVFVAVYRCARKAEWYFRRAFFRSLVTVGGCTLKKEDARGTTINKQIQWIFVPRLWNLFWGVLSLADKRIAPWMAVSRLPRQRSRSDTQPHFKSTRS